MSRYSARGERRQEQAFSLDAGGDEISGEWPDARRVAGPSAEYLLLGVLLRSFLLATAPALFPETKISPLPQKGFS
jgi:hypothetical protein